MITLYRDIQRRMLTPELARQFLTVEGAKLKQGGEDYFYEVRKRFNDNPSSFDFLFLNRSCSNGVMRFNRRGKFNVPFCRKPDRFAQSYITKICNQIRAIADVLTVTEWEFEATDFRTALSTASESDLVYADPPYAGRHVDYFNSWRDEDEKDLSNVLAHLPCRFILSTWHSNEYRTNHLIRLNWSLERYHILTREHFYHVGSSEDLRHPMIEALITNFPVEHANESHVARQQHLFLEQQRAQYGAF